MPKIVARTKAIKVGHPLDPSTMIGAQCSTEQMLKISSYLEIGKKEGAEVYIRSITFKYSCPSTTMCHHLLLRCDAPQVLCGGEVHKVVDGGYYVQPTIFKGHNKMRVFQDEIFGPVASVTTFKTTEEAIAIANDTMVRAE